MNWTELKSQFSCVARTVQSERTDRVQFISVQFTSFAPYSPLIWTRNILDCDQSNVLLAHYFQFSAKFLKFCQRIWLTSFNNSALKTFARRKYLGYISHTSWVIANFGSKFVAMATRVGRGRLWLTSFNSLTPKTPCRAQGSRRYLSYNLSYSQFCLKFRCHGNKGRSEVNLNDPVELAVPENHTSLNWCHILLFATLGT